MTRQFTQSKYDHVAMLLRFSPEKDEVFVLDATSAGVQVTRWSDFRLLQDKSYYHFFYRPLIALRDEDFSSNL